MRLNKALLKLMRSRSTSVFSRRKSLNLRKTSKSATKRKIRP